jgi:GTP-binding protein
VAVGLDIFKQEAKFVAGAASVARLPRFNLPEIAFIGKSNVGKSSLINMICRRKKLARTSNTPGQTRQINFFSLADKFLLVDLPGYGYAKVSKHERESWEKLIVHYLQKSQDLKLINLLIDSRHGAKPNDLEVIQLLVEAGRNFQIIFTKSDKKESDDKSDINIENFLASLNHSCNVIYTSSRTGVGAKELQVSIIKSI